VVRNFFYPSPLAPSGEERELASLFPQREGLGMREESIGSSVDYRPGINFPWHKPVSTGLLEPDFLLPLGEGLGMRDEITVWVRQQSGGEYAHLLNSLSSKV